MATVGTPRERTLWDPLYYPRRRQPLLHVWSGERYTSWSWDDWYGRALRFAAGLRRRGVQPDDRVACLLTNSPEACAAVLGTWLAGACLVSVPAMARGMGLEQYLGQIRRIIAQAEPNILVVAAELVQAFGQACSRISVVGFEELDTSTRIDPVLADSHQAVFVQYSSGSTREPRGCVLSAGAIARQLTMLEYALRVDATVDVGVAWLPLSHDMGLFGCLLLVPYWTGTEFALSTPQRFLMSPQSWFADCARFGATITAGPNFALELTARIASALPPDAIPMRRVVVGGERVDSRTLDRVCQALGPDRLARHALIPAYGLAEAVLAVTMTHLGEGPHIVGFESEALARGYTRPAPSDGSTRQNGSVAVTSCGPPLPGNSVEIVGEADVGEVRVRSASLADGYLATSEAAAQRFTPDGLLTGDIGFVLDRNLFITGRLDDLITVAGRNVYKRDIETAIVAMGGIRPGNCALVEVVGHEPKLVVVVEPVDNHPALSLLAERIAAAALESAGVRVAECVFLPRGAFPKTPSGKIQRFRCQELAADLTFTAAERISPSGSHRAL